MDDCQLPEPFRAYIELFNGGKFFASHEVLEGAWLINSSDFYRGLIIYAAAYVKRDWLNPRGVALNFNKALTYLRHYTPYYMGLDVAALVAHAEDCLAALALLPAPAGPTQLEAAIPSIRLEPNARLIRGEEPELR